MFEIKDLSKQYGTEFALQNVTMTIGKGMNFIIGASGSGKTTLLKILCCMEKGFDGSVFYLGKNINSFSDKEKSTLYNNVFGFVWQDFHLLEEATVLENILMPQYLKGEVHKKSVDAIVKQMKLNDIRDKKVKYLSGGQKQRVAIARELMKNPQVIFCDEPTSALDAQSAKIIMDVLRGLSKSKTVIVVTHDVSLIQKTDAVFELDKGELISVPENQREDNLVWKDEKRPVLSVKNAFQIAFMNMKNKAGRFVISALSLVIAGMLLVTAFSGTIQESGRSEFEQLVETYGEGILDIGLVGNFISAAGGEEDKPDADVSQDLNGLYETYEDDERVEFIVSMQPFENINLTLDGETYTVEKTGNSPVLTKLLSGDIPSGKEFQVVVPVNFVKSIGLTEESVLGKKIDFSATIFQWIDDQPFEKPVQIQATVCGVADNTVVYDYEGQTYSYTVDDSFFFNKAAIEEVRKQAGIEGEEANFTIRAKTPEDLISLKDELNKMGIVPLGRFELVEDIVRLNQQTEEQSGSATIVIGVLSVLGVVIIFAMTSILRKREYAIYKVSGYSNGHLIKITAVETFMTAIIAAVTMLIASLILSRETGVLLILGVSVIAFVAELPAVMQASVSTMLKVGDKS